MNDVATTTYRAPGKIGQLQAEVMSPERKAALVQTLPAHVKPERFERNLYFTMTQVRDIDKCSAEDIFNEVLKIASLGLYLDLQLGEAYLIVGKGYKIQARVGYRGLVKLARQSGEVTEFYAHEVYLGEYEAGRFLVRLGDDKKIEHEPLIVGDRGEYIGAYAVVKFANGGGDFDWMPLADIHKIRDRSDAYKAFKAGNIKSTPWDTDEIEMAKKTVIRRLSKRLPASPELSAALALEDGAEGYATFDDNAPARPRLADRFKAPASADGFNHDNVQRQLNANGQQPVDTAQPREPVPSTTDTTSSRSEAGDDAGGETDTSSNGLTADDFNAYASALARVASKESLDKADANFWKGKGKLSEADNRAANAINAVHVARVNGNRTPDQARAEVEAIIAEATGL